MTTFNLVRRDDGRVVLDVAKEKDTDILQTITAPTWLDAREKVKEINYYHNPGYGWYER